MAGVLDTSLLTVSVAVFSEGALATMAPNIDISTTSGAKRTLETLSTLQSRIAEERGIVGAAVSRLEVAARNLHSWRETTEMAEARISDVDMAEQAAAHVRELILQQAGAAVLSSANQSPALALSLLQ